jgi:plasmid replication initiation protein/uncharacterized Zn finger protein (UPF0148 family)
MKKELIETVDNVKMEVSMMAITRAIDQKNLIVTQANALARSVQEMTLQEKRLLLLAISHIRQSDDNFVLYRIPVTRIREYLGLDDGSYYTRINKITTSLLSRVIEVEKENGDWEKFQWVSYCRYRRKGTSDMPEACLDIRMHDCLRPLLLNLQKYFGSVCLHQIAPIPGFNSMRVFELLYYSAMYSKKERKFKKSKLSFEVTDLKKRLGMEGKYRDFRDFRKDVLNRAQKDCEVYSPLVFTWEEEKKGRKIVALHFTIKLNPKFKDESLALLNQQAPETLLVNTEFELIPTTVLKPAKSPFARPASTPKKPKSKGNSNPVSELASNVVTTEQEAKELIFDYALATFSADEKRQALAALSGIPTLDQQMILDELNVAIGQGNVKKRWQYLTGLVKAYHNGLLVPTSDLARQRKEVEMSAKAKHCPYCDTNGMIYYRIKDGAVLPKPCSHNESEIIDFAISKEYNIENAKSSNNRLNAIKTEFEETRHQKVKEIVQSWDENTKRAEIRKFLKTTDNFTRQLFQEKGLNHPATLAHLTLYMVKNNYLPPEFNSLKDWHSMIYQ